MDMIACCQMECYRNDSSLTPVTVIFRDSVSNKVKVWCIRKASDYFWRVTLNQDQLKPYMSSVLLPGNKLLVGIPLKSLEPLVSKLLFQFWYKTWKRQRVSLAAIQQS